MYNFQTKNFEQLLESYTLSDFRKKVKKFFQENQEYKNAEIEIMGLCEDCLKSDKIVMVIINIHKRGD